MDLNPLKEEEVKFPIFRIETIGLKEKVEKDAMESGI